MFKRLLLTATMALTLAVMCAGTVSAAPAQTSVAPTPCIQSLQPTGTGAGGGPGQEYFMLRFTATCPGRILVEWQAIAANGHVAWKSDDHNFVVSTTTANMSTSSTWFYAKTPAGIYDLYVTLASQNGRLVYYHELWGLINVP